METSEAKAVTGRLTRPPHPQLFELLYAPAFEADRGRALPWLLEIDAAHLLMLGHQALLPPDTVADLLGVNRDLAQRCSAQGAEVVLPAPPVHRGLYLLYEQQYIDRLGPERGGAAHLARSRNDINAALVRLRLRQAIAEHLDAALDLLAAAARLGHAHVETVMSGFTHLQPAQPTSLAHYLVGVTSELERAVARLVDLLGAIDRSPLGAAAGLGTSFAIDRDRVARLLGFEGVIASSLDAVASRDFAVRTLAELAQIGTTLSRWALDFQLWGSRAYGFLDWTDDLVSTSSIMPQKRNAYVWEDIRGLAVKPAGALVDALMGGKNTPFSNSVEAGTAAVSTLWPALRASVKALRLASLLIANTSVRPQRMRQFAVDAETTMTAVADHLVAVHGMAFRAAHDLVGQAVQRAFETHGEGSLTDPELLAELLNESLPASWAGGPLEAERLDELLQPEHSLHAAAYGGGPAPAMVRPQLQELEQRVDDHRTEVARRRAVWCDARQQLDAEATRFCREVSGESQ